MNSLINDWKLAKEKLNSVMKSGSWFESLEDATANERPPKVDNLNGGRAKRVTVEWFSGYISSFKDESRTLCSLFVCVAI